MKGYVDDNRRALMAVLIGASEESTPVEIEAWLDTAFDGHFVFASSLIKELGLDTLVETEAILADGSIVALQTFVCFVDWFGEKIPAEVFENEGRFPLLGTALMDGRKLLVDFENRSVELN